jgi:hypothetical protein
MKKILTITILSILFLIRAYSQQGMWEQTAGTPDGSGITGLAVANNGYLFATTGSYDFFNSDTGGVHRSTDGGSTWEKVFPAYIARTIEIDSNGVIFASIWDWPNSNEGIYKSTDMGTTWIPVHILGNSDNVFSIEAYSGGVLYAGSRKGVIVSTDNGNTWNTNPSFPTGETWVLDVETDISGYIYAASYAGFYISSDDGVTWNTAQGIDPGDTVTSLGVYLPTEFDKTPFAKAPILAGTTNGKIYKSPFSGFNFLVVFVVALSTYGNFNSINNFMIGSTRRIATLENPLPTGATGGAVVSFDGGENWVFKNEGLPPNSTASIVAVDPSTLRAGSVFYLGLFDNQVGGARIFKRTFTVTNIENTNNETVDNFNLEQNYPNPFNPSTKIRFDLPSSGYTSLKVYDILGKEVAVLVNEELSAGSYEFTWNAHSLSSGTYFYELKTKEYSLRRKMLLLK